MIEVINASKSYKNKVLDNINLKVEANNFCCLLGRNGVGKSTLLNIITHAVKPDTGKVIINGSVFNGDAILIKEKLGVVGQADQLIDQLTGYQHLVFQCLIFHLPESQIVERIKGLTSYFFDDYGDIHQPIKSFSSGMRMKLRIIAALLHNPELLIMDEPFANLDPIAAERLAVLLKKFAAKNKNVVLISSHDLMYVDKIATQICVLDNRQIVFNDSKDTFTKGNTNDLDKTLLDLINYETFSPEKLDLLL